MSFERVEIGKHTLYRWDAMEVLPTLSPVDCVVTDPPYGETSLEWDRRVPWQQATAGVLSDHGSIWCFGSLRHFLEDAANWKGWSLAQDVLWEKHNGTNALADRFRRVHEHAAQFYKSSVLWSGVVKNPLFTNDATARAVRRKKRPPQWGDIGASAYESHDGGPRLMRSVMFCRSCHGSAEHPTQKPVETIEPLILYSTNANAVVLDPFMGSGTTGVACERLGRRFIGIEKEPKYFDIACRRIEDAIHAEPLFAEVCA